MNKNKNALRNEDLEKVSGGRRRPHTHHTETRMFLKRLFHRGDDSLLCENPKHRQKQG